MACHQEITCPKCAGNNIAKSGVGTHGVQRYRCRHPELPTKTFMPNYRYWAYEPGIKARAIEMAINIRDTARMPKTDKNTVISTLKKSSAIVQVTPLYLKDTGKPLEVRLEPACEESELDGQWSCRAEAKPALAVVRRWPCHQHRSLENARTRFSKA